MSPGKQQQKSLHLNKLLQYCTHKERKSSNFNSWPYNKRDVTTKYAACTSSVKISILRLRPHIAKMKHKDTHCVSASSISLFLLTESSRRSSNGFINIYNPMRININMWCHILQLWFIWQCQYNTEMYDAKFKQPKA